VSRLAAALAWAARGFPVFPLVPGSKTPLHDDWPSVASTDPDVIRSLWSDPVLRTEHDYNIGTLCTDRVVVDIDVKSGKDGYNEYAQIGGHYDTLVVRTPTGGYHCYFEGPDSANAPISSAIDVRSHNGFVVAPGSEIDGVAYTVVCDRDPAWVPLEVERYLRPPYSRPDSAVTAALDSPAMIEAARGYLEGAPVAVEGQRGDETTFTTAARLVREMALSPAVALDLMWHIWNPRCQPPWGYEELTRKVENAAAYGTAHMARLDPSMLFRTVSVDSAPKLSDLIPVEQGTALLPDAIPPRPWIMDRLLMLYETTLVLAPGSAGKSSIALAIAAHLSLGMSFGKYTARTKCKSIVYNGEDDVAEQSRRLYAVCQAYNLDYNEVRQRVILLSADTFDLRIISSQGRTPYVNETMVDQLVDLASDPDVGMLVFDPLVDIHDVDEGDNPHMNFVMRTLQKIARRANVANLVLHHTTKAGSAKQEERVGNMDISRGASGIVYKSRIALTLMNATTQDCEDFGLQDAERLNYVRLDDAKMNLALASAEPTWLRKEGCRLPNGDLVGVLRLTELKKSTMHIRTRIANILIETLTANGQASMPIGQAVAVVKSEEPIYANKTDTDIRKRIEGLFATPVEIRGHTLHARREGEGAKTTLLIVMT
jgi:hypothetical protein